jgi:hypothetical protein
VSGLQTPACEGMHAAGKTWIAASADHATIDRVAAAATTPQRQAGEFIGRFAKLLVHDRDPFALLWGVRAPAAR